MLRLLIYTSLLSILLTSAVAQEIGDNDFRISDTGGTGNPAFAAVLVAIAYNSSDNEYLVVWNTDDTDTEGIVDGEFEVFGRRINAATGARIGDDFRISDAGGTGDASVETFAPAVAYNSSNNEYLVVWNADDTDTPGVADDEFEIFGQRIDAATGIEVGVNDFRISDAGGTGDGGFIGPGRPAVAYNPTNNGYLVVWLANDPDTAGIVAGELEIFGQCLDAATGNEVGVNDFRISDVRGTGTVSTRVGFPVVAYSPTNNEYLVVWQAEDTDTAGIVDGEREVFGQRLAAATGAEIGANDFRISDAGGTGNPAFPATRPAVAYNTTNDEYLVVWQAEDTDTAGIVDGELEVFGQRLAAATGAEVGVNDFRISDVGGTGFPDFDAFFPGLTYNATNNEYLVVWQADDTDTPGIVDEEFEVFGQRLEAAAGGEIGNDFRISDVGGTGVRPSAFSVRGSATTRPTTSIWWRGKRTTRTRPGLSTTSLKSLARGSSFPSSSISLNLGMEAA